MKLHCFFFIAAAMMLTACATQETLVPTGGSRSGGTVQLSYEYGLFQVPQVNMDRATQTAADKCAVWGYSGAQPFGGQINRCEQFNAYGTCIQTLVTMTFQCTGNPSGGN